MSARSDVLETIGRPFPNSGIDLSRLHKAKIRAGKVVAQCPACAEVGADRSGEHLVIFDQGAGKWGCVAFPGDKEHRRQIAGAVGNDGVRPLRTILPLRPLTPSAPRRFELPAVRKPSVVELAKIAEMRGLPAFAGLELAARAGMLWSATMRDNGASVEAWILTDSARVSAQARRMDGQPWASIGGVKAKTLPGSQAAWPIGAADIGTKPFVALCEGGPDTLAAWTLAWWHGTAADVQPVCMCGAGNSIHGDALPLFEGKGIWVFPHRDDAGARACAKWTEELSAAGALWVRPFTVEPHKDLNEWLVAAVAALEDEQ